MGDRLNAAFDSWLDAQRAALETVRTATGVPGTDVDLAEGFRWVTRLSTLALEWLVEKSTRSTPSCSPSKMSTASSWSTTPTCTTSSVS